jgi:hypothetical protein
MSNYSFSTSLPPYQERPIEKKRQANELFAFIYRGANNLLQLSELTGLPQSTVAGRCNDLVFEKRIIYNGHTIYKDRKRKKIVALKNIAPGTQQKIFD